MINYYRGQFIAYFSQAITACIVAFSLKNPHFLSFGVAMSLLGVYNLLKFRKEKEKLDKIIDRVMREKK